MSVMLRALRLGFLQQPLLFHRPIVKNVCSLGGNRPKIFRLDLIHLLHGEDLAKNPSMLAPDVPG